MSLGVRLLPSRASAKRAQRAESVFQSCFCSMNEWIPLLILEILNINSNHLGILLKGVFWSSKSGMETWDSASLTSSRWWWFSWSGDHASNSKILRAPVRKWFSPCSMLSKSFLTFSFPSFGDGKHSRDWVKMGCLGTGWGEVRLIPPSPTLSLWSSNLCQLDGWNMGTRSCRELGLFSFWSIYHLCLSGTVLDPRSESNVSKFCLLEIYILS